MLGDIVFKALRKVAQAVQKEVHSSTHVGGVGCAFTKGIVIRDKRVKAIVKSLKLIFIDPSSISGFFSNI